jgi:hypothetical protein
MAVSRYQFDVEEARAGYANVDYAFDATLLVKSAEGSATDFAVAGPVSTVPEPSTYALMGTGLLGLAVAARRRRSA